MELQNLSRWQWVLIGLVLGLVLAFAYSRWDRSSGRLQAAPADFENGLLQVDRRAEGDPPVIRNIVLHPPVGGSEYEYLTFERIDRNKRAYVKYTLIDRRPWQVTNPNGTDLRRNGHVSGVREYLEKVKAANPSFNYTYAWWDEWQFVYPIWMGVSALVVGGIWPTVINLMIGAGLAPPRQPKEKRIKLTASKPEPAPPPKPSVDEEEVAAIAAAYEQNLARDASEGAPAAEAESDQPQAAPIPKLTGGPVEPLPVMKQEDDEPKEYVGEFYPVAKAKPKKDD